ncbi:hypothetical protein D3C73_1481090 [compost metagenome]
MADRVCRGQQHDAFADPALQVWNLHYVNEPDHPVQPLLAADDLCLAKHGQLHQLS